MLAVIAIGYTHPTTFAYTFPLGIALLLILSLVLQIAILRRLTELLLPDQYVSKFRLQSTLVQIGNVVTLSMFAYGIASRFL